MTRSIGGTKNKKSFYAGYIQFTFQTVELKDTAFLEPLPERQERGAYNNYRRYPPFAISEIPRDSAVNCREFCDSVYRRILRRDDYFDSCMGVCASKLT